MSLSQYDSALYTREETARMLRVSLATLDNWVRADKGPEPTRLNGRVLFMGSSISRFVHGAAERVKQDADDGNYGLAGLIESELLASCEPDPTMRPVIHAFAEALAALRDVDIAVRADTFKRAQAQQFVAALNRLSAGMRHFSQDVVRESLAGAIVSGAILTASQVFPDLLAEAADNE